MAITRRAALAALVLAPTAALADPASREPIEESPLFVSDLLNWDGTTDDEWRVLHDLATRFVIENTESVQELLKARAAMVAHPDDSDAPGATTQARAGIPEEVGECRFWVSTAGGTTEGGNVPTASTHGATLMQVGVNVTDGDGGMYSVLYDGAEVCEIQAATMAQASIDLTGAMMDPGTHVVELMRADGSVYKRAEINLVE